MNTDLKVWLDHFEYHSTHRCVLPAGKPGDLTSRERRLIGRSIATFQLGERSEGRSLLLAAQRYEREHDAAPLARIFSLLIAEERHHAALLGAFMDGHGIPRKCGDWTDHAFRRLRRLAGFELYLSVLVTAELIGKVYYRALEAATGSRQLRTLCRMLVADELAHIGLETDLLRGMHEKKSPPVRWLRTIALRAFFTGASLVVWFEHRRVLRSAGYRLATFTRACAAQYSFYLEPPRLHAAEYV
ncbi:MAG: hypothetical protein WDO68_08560 [Gammaproteobacteria bacterium]